MPLASRTYRFGELQGEKDVRSSRHWNVAGSFAENLKVADVDVVLPGGLASRIV
jgi:hypothetical protein